MTDLSNKIPIPPLHELSADRLEARKNHLLAEITPAAKSRVTRRARRARLVVLLAAGAAVATVAAVLALTLGGGSTTPNSSGRGHSNGGPFPYRVRLRYVRRSGTLVAVPLTVEAPYRNASVRVRVVRGTKREVVFRRTARMHDLARPTRSGMRSSWSSVLKPSHWRGGCERSQYKVEIFVRRGRPSGGPSAARIETGSFFTCR
jgi:hypothetical protein